VKSGPALASVTLDERWAHLRGGDFVVIDKERDVMPIANDPDQERRLWDTTRALLNQALPGLLAPAKSGEQPLLQ
jgi:hypothetical protein